MKQYIEAAQRAHDELLPLLGDAIADAQDRLSKAKATADHDAVTPQLVELLNNADTPPADAIGGIIATYAALLNNPGTRDGAWLIRSLASTAKHHGLKDAQTGQIAGAIIGAIHGKAPVSLIEWPAADAWHKQLHHADRMKWAAWLAPKEHAKLMKRMEATAQARISAETDLIQLEHAREALADLVPESVSSARVRIRNNTDHTQGVAGCRWKAGETVELEPSEYAALVDSQGFQRLADSGQLEVIA